MPEYTLRIRRYDPDSGDGAHWDEHTVDMPETQSVLDAILKIKDDTDGSIGIRCSCQQAICGSCAHERQRAAVTDSFMTSPS